MKKYTIEITETLQKQVTIEACNSGEALKEVKRLYNDGDIVLYGEDHVSTEIEKIEEEL